MIGATSLAKVGAALSAAFVLLRLDVKPTTIKVALRTPRSRFIRILLFAFGYDHPRVAVNLSAGPLFIRCGLRTHAKVLLIACVIKITDHHLFPGLWSPADKLCRIGIELVSLGIVVMRDALQATALRRCDRLFEEVSQLPTEVITWHEQQDLRRTVRIDQLVLKILAAEMHV